ncbi:MAG: NTP transferase domain-containing protein [Paracoccaceae bacterium]
MSITVWCMTQTPAPPPPLHILILAAGAARRMRGSDKLLEPVAGQPLLRHIVQQAIGSGYPVTVALPPDRPERLSALSGLPIRPITVAHPDRGMAESLRAGLANLPDAAAVLLLLADLPEITTEDLRLMADAQAAFPDLILRATDETGHPGHPVVFPPWTRTDLMGLSGDEGARQVLRTHADRLHFVALSGHHATTDLDTPEAWAAWRSGRE